MKNLIQTVMFIIAFSMINQLASAQIIYTNVSPDQSFSASNSSYDLDLNNDGVTDFRIYNSVGSSSPYGYCREYYYPPCSCNGNKTNTLTSISAGAGNLVSYSSSLPKIDASLSWIGYSYVLASKSYRCQCG